MQRDLADHQGAVLTEVLSALLSSFGLLAHLHPQHTDVCLVNHPILFFFLKIVGHLGVHIPHSGTPTKAILVRIVHPLADPEDRDASRILSLLWDRNRTLIRSGPSPFLSCSPSQGKYTKHPMNPEEEPDSTNLTPKWKTAAQDAKAHFTK